MLGGGGEEQGQGQVENGEEGSLMGERRSSFTTSSLEPLNVESGENSGFEEEDGYFDFLEEFAPPRHASAWSVVLMLLSCTIGIGVMSLSDSFARLGWVLATVIFVFYAVVNQYCGMLYYEAARLFHVGYGPAELAHVALKNKHYTGFVLFILHGYMILLTSGLLIVSSQTMAGMFDGVMTLCTPVWGAITVVILLPFLQLKTFHSMRWILGVSMLTFFIATVAIMVLYIGYCVSNGPSTTEVIPADLTVGSFFIGMSKIVFAFVGTDLYLQFMSEMTDPTEFPRTMLGTNIAIFFIYYIVSIVLYIRLGNVPDSFMLDALPEDNSLSNFINAVLFIHVAINYVLNLHVVIKWFYIRAIPASPSGIRRTRPVLWFFISLGVAALTYFISCGIPLISQLISLSGSLQVPFLGVIFPVVASIATKRHFSLTISPLQWVIYVLLLCFATLSFVVGTYASIYDLVKSYQDMEPLFATCAGNTTLRGLLS